jgi:hypothetical protein
MSSCISYEETRTNGNQDNLNIIHTKSGLLIVDSALKRTKNCRKKPGIPAQQFA